MIQWIRTTWCKSMHNQAMWPIHGRYICPTCLQEYPVAWEGPVTTAEYANLDLRQPVSEVATVPHAPEQRLC
jgi:hypothetical protein